MDSFFGIGIAELFFIAILALIILGPERLPGAIREVAKVIRYVRNLTTELTSQFGDEMKAFDDLNPQKILNEMLEEPDSKKKAAAKATAAKPAAKTTTTAPKPATPKPATAKPPTPKPAAPKPAADKPADAAAIAAGEAAEASDAPKRAEPPTIKGTLVPPSKATAAISDDHAAKTDVPAAATDSAPVDEPSILPPQTGEAAGPAKTGDDKVTEKPAQPTTVAVNGTAASVDGSEG